MWTLDMDDYSGQFCEQGQYPLISHLKHKLSEGEAIFSYQGCKFGSQKHQMGKGPCTVLFRSVTYDTLHCQKYSLSHPNN